MAALDAGAFADQVQSYRETGNYGSRYGDYTARGGAMVKTFNDEELQRLSAAAYAAKPTVPKGISYVPSLSSYEAKVFVKPGAKEVVIAYAGTRPWRPADLGTDIQLARGKLSSTARFKRSQDTLAAVRRALPGYRVTVTGHSLGGSIAEQLAAPNAEAVSFNPGRRIDKPLQRLKSKLQGRLRNDDDSRYNSRAYISRYDYVSAERYLNRDSGRSRYYTNSTYMQPFRAHTASFYKRRYK